MTAPATLIDAADYPLVQQDAAQPQTAAVLSAAREHERVMREHLGAVRAIEALPISGNTRFLAEALRDALSASATFAALVVAHLEADK